MKDQKKVDLLVDLQFGSTGKGLLAGYLSAKNNYDVVISANMPNAGHTFIDADGNVMIHKVLPSGVNKGNLKWLLIGPGAVFSFDRLLFEMDQLKKFGYKFELGIHEHAVVLDDAHKMSESKSNYVAIGSTQQGSAEAMMAKIRRDVKDNPTARARLGDAPYVLSHAKYVDVLYMAHRVLAEGAQGYSLGINAGFWPYCTSRDCTPARFCADMIIPMPWVKDVFGVARTYPIRVGGTSGPGYRDQEEITWHSLGVKAERTTVTNRERRVFTFSRRQMWEAMLICQPTAIFLNFCNYMETKREQLGKIIDRTDADARELGCGGVRYLGWGPTINDIQDLNYGPKIETPTGAQMDDSAVVKESISS